MGHRQTTPERAFLTRRPPGHSRTLWHYGVLFLDEFTEFRRERDGTRCDYLSHVSANGEPHFAHR
jgi:hypothetical protein